MALVIDATVGGASSNSYVTMERANTLLEGLPHAGDWFTDYTINRVQLIIHATRLIDRHIDFNGLKATTSQALEWPRQSIKDVRTNEEILSTIIPEFVEWATVEWAFELYLNADQGTNLVPGVRSLRTPSYDIEFSGAGGKKLIPDVVGDLLLPYGERVPRGGIRLMRA